MQDIIMDIKRHDAMSFRILHCGNRWLTGKMAVQEIKGGRQGQEIGRLRKRYRS